jgi:hypothetical protein
MFADRIRSLPSRIPKWLGFEKKSGLASPESWLLDLFGATPSIAGIALTPRTAMTCAPVRCAVQAIAETIGQLPVQVYQRGEDGSNERDQDHPKLAVLPVYAGTDDLAKLT